ncbi:MAG: hypothetical protein ACLTAI_02640 [Thomasclavelia sp.]
MALFNFGKKKEEEKKTPACACSCGGAASEAESITNDCCPDLKEGEICCIKVLGQVVNPVTNNLNTQSRQ